MVMFKKKQSDIAREEFNRQKNQKVIPAFKELENALNSKASPKKCNEIIRRLEFELGILHEKVARWETEEFCKDNQK